MDQIVVLPSWLSVEEMHFIRLYLPQIVISWWIWAKSNGKQRIYHFRCHRHRSQQGSKMQILGCNLKNDRMTSVRFQGKPFNITVIQVYAPTSNAEEAEVEWFYEDLQDLLEVTPPKDVLFMIGDCNAKVGSQETLGVTGKFGFGVQNEAGQRLIRVLPRKRTGHSKHPLPTTQGKTLHMDITRWSTPKSDRLYSLQPKMEKLYIVNNNKKRLGTDCGQIMNSLLPNSGWSWRE